MTGLKRQNTNDVEMTDSSQPSNLKRTRSNNASQSKKARHMSNQIVKAPTQVGKVFVFGTGDTGQLGLGDEMLERKKPMPLNAFDGDEIVDVVSGGMHSVAITSQGKLWTWGCNDQRALGRSGEEYEPARVEGMDNVKIVKVACCDSVTMALSEEGILYCWGTYRCAEGPLGFSRNKAVQETPAVFEPFAKVQIADIAAGTDHCLALTRDGRVFVWGNGQQFQLGRRIMERHLINGLRPEALNLKSIKLIGTGSYHSFAVSHDNTLYVWGLNNFQQCGLVDSEETNEPAPNVITKPTVVTALEGKGTIKDVQGGEHHSLVLMEDGTIYAFGRADSDQLGLPADLIDKVQTKEEGAEVSNFKRAVGLPTRIPSLKDVVSISTGTNHSIAVTSDGKAYTWGFGECYALGNGSSDDEPIPTELTGQKLEGHKVVRVSAGAQHSMILATSQ
ncbi:regulator of chromosome condensation 1/beta-lactamase-inhibitor protein II [Gilbertella persicaria]|uniref:regulator of chromosome condensation 1/beta-lactamase-inhibitor protein II n=1 Tax=Gilbertella persicaria TaxID=101096 RepID=UPI00221ED7D7|nr:regulator of chromosome condensation 1/beta-lactamase-inhibitor protein II [Gilbertella persicaria]KAI8090984.1 regulator of chromosome condensation 1/beta-lactamase-inhibitor protein II [Gilbertella persicaria]